MKAVRFYAIVLGLSIGVATLIKAWVIESIRVPPGVMAPTLDSGDYALSIVIPGLLSQTIQYGDIVVYAPPSEPTRTYLKRVIGKSGDRIAIKNGALIFNNKSLEFIDSPEFQGPLRCGKEVHPQMIYSICLSQPGLVDTFEHTIPKDSYFVVGDHRNSKVSARTWDIIPQSAIQSKVFRIWLSLDLKKEGSIPSLQWNRLGRKPN